MPKYSNPKDLYEEAFNDGYDAGRLATLKEIGEYLKNNFEETPYSLLWIISELLKGEMPCD